MLDTSDFAKKKTQQNENDGKFAKLQFGNKKIYKWVLEEVYQHQSQLKRYTFQKTSI